MTLNVPPLRKDTWKALADGMKSRSRSSSKTMTTSSPLIFASLTTGPLVSTSMLRWFDARFPSFALFNTLSLRIWTNTKPSYSRGILSLTEKREPEVLSGGTASAHAPGRCEHVIVTSSMPKPVTLCEKRTLTVAESCVAPIHLHEIEVVGGTAASLAAGGFAAEGVPLSEPNGDGSSARTVDGTRNAQMTAAARKERTARPDWFGIIVSSPRQAERAVE